jgi:hypothetical protein
MNKTITVENELIDKYNRAVELRKFAAYIEGGQ